MNLVDEVDGTITLLFPAPFPTRRNGVKINRGKLIRTRNETHKPKLITVNYSTVTLKV